MWAVTDFTRHNGGTRIVPGSHLTGVNPDPTVPHRVTTIALEVRAGQAVVFDGRNIFDPRHVRALGFTYKSIGRP